MKVEYRLVKVEQSTFTSRHYVPEVQIWPCLGVSRVEPAEFNSLLYQYQVPKQFQMGVVPDSRR